MADKKWYESKVVLMNMLLGLAMMVSVFSPPVADFIKSYFGADAAMGWAFINIILRVFKSNVVL